jgi:hypothetical protein
LRGSELVLSFMPVAELRMGAIPAGWDIRREHIAGKPCAHYLSYFAFARAPQTIRPEMPGEPKESLKRLAS